MNDNKFKTSIFSVSTYLLIYYVLGVIIQLIIKRLTNDAIAFQAISNIVIYVILFASLIFINKKDLVIQFKTLKKDNKPISKILICLALVYFSSYIIELISQIISHYANFSHFIFDGKLYLDTTSDNQNSIITLLKSNYGVLMFVSASILGPICEELTYRKGIMGLFKKEETGVIISSILFSLVHIISSFGSYNFISLLLMFVSYFVSGFAFGIIYYKTKNIWYSTIAHTLYNTIAMLLILFL